MQSKSMSISSTSLQEVDQLTGSTILQTGIICSLRTFCMLVFPVIRRQINSLTLHASSFATQLSLPTRSQSGWPLLGRAHVSAIFFVQVKVCITKTSISLTSKKMPEPSHQGPMKRSVVNAEKPIKDQPVSPTSFQFLWIERCTYFLSFTIQLS